MQEVCENPEDNGGAPDTAKPLLPDATPTCKRRELRQQRAEAIARAVGWQGDFPCVKPPCNIPAEWEPLLKRLVGGDALPLLRTLAGPVAPAAWRGALPITYHIGP